MTNASFASQLKRAIDAAAKAHDADIFLLVGGISEGLGHSFIELCPPRSRAASNCILSLITPGGDLEAAYRIARCIQDRYAGGNFILFTDGVCKSAGTLIAMGANALFMTDHAELGPLDTQVMVRDEFGESESGLIDTDALRKLGEEAFTTFQEHFGRLKSLGSGNLTTHTALRTASDLTLGLFGGIYSKIDPLRLGERARAIELAMEYGLGVRSNNVKDGTLERLATGYPSHGFQIDRREAGELFWDVHPPDKHLGRLAELLRMVRSLDSDIFILENLNHEVSDYFSRLVEIIDESDSEDDQDSTNTGEPP